MWYVNILRKNTSVQKCCKQKLKLVFNEETCTDELKQLGSVGGATSPPAVTAFLRKPPDRRRSPVNAAAPSGESVCSQWPELLQARDQHNYKHTQPWAHTLKLTAQILSEIIFLVVSNSPDGAGTVRGGADARPDVVVVALVLVLLLTPHKISVWKTIRFCFHQVERERWELREKDIWRQECCEVFEWFIFIFHSVIRVVCNEGTEASTPPPKCSVHTFLHTLWPHCINTLPLPVRCGQPPRSRPSLCSCALGSVRSRSCRCRKWFSSPFLGWQLQARRLGLYAWSGSLQDDKHKLSITQRETTVCFRWEEVCVSAHLAACHQSWTWPQGVATVTLE